MVKKLSVLADKIPILKEIKKNKTNLEIFQNETSVILSELGMRINILEDFSKNLSEEQKVLLANLNKIAEEIASLSDKTDKYFIENQSNLSSLNNRILIRESKKNKPLFLLGSGPSLAKCDIPVLKNCYTMAFNRSYIAFKDWGFEPTYFAGLDHVVNDDNKVEFQKLIINSKIKRFFFSADEMSRRYLASEKTSLVEIDEYSYLEPNLDFQNPLKVSNSGLFGLQIALKLLGFTEVYLLGCDANYVEKLEGIEVKGGKYFSNKDKDVNHFRSDYYGKGTVYNKPEAIKFHLPAWKFFYEKYIKENNSEYKVYNSSEDGRLTFFPYADIKEVEKNINIYEYK